MVTEITDKIHIRVIDNSNKRLDILRRLLDFMVSQKLCWVLNDLYIIKANIIPTQYSTKEEHLLSMLQQDSLRKGFYYNCFNMNDYATKDTNEKANS